MLNKSKIPERLGNYRLTRHIRAGAGTEIYHAIQLDSQHKCVLKILSPKALGNREKIQQLRHEYQVAGHLQHSNLLKVNEFAKQAPFAWIALEPFAGQSLRQWLADKQRDELLQQLPNLVEQMCQALWHLHQHGWAHCGVKPANFLIDPQFNLKLIDFSLAKRIQQHKLQFWLTKHRPLGSPNYLAPEQIRQQSVDARVDSYSLGCTLFEWIEGRVPYTGASQNELLNKHLSAKIPKLTVRSQHVTPALAELIAAMMAKDPAHRPDNMLRIHQAFQRLFNQTTPLPAGSFSIAGATHGSVDFSHGSSSVAKATQFVDSELAHARKKTTAAAPWKKKLSHAIVPWLQWRWLAVAVVLCALAAPIAWWWFPENDTVERQALNQLQRVAGAIEQAPQLSTPAERQQYWQTLQREIESVTAAAQQHLPPGSAARPDRLELHWSANLLPRAAQEGAVNLAQQPILAIVKEHLRNADEYLQQRQTQREAGAITLEKISSSSPLFWLLVVADIVGAALVLRLFLQKRKSTQS